MEDVDSGNSYTNLSGKQEGRRIYKNIGVLSVSLTLLFTSYLGMSNLQSSLNQTDGLGNWSSAVTSGVLVFSALFLPTPLIRRVGCKWTIFAASFGYVIYIAAQLHPRFYTMMPAAVVCGLASAPLWAACSVYIIQLGQLHVTSNQNNANSEDKNKNQDNVDVTSVRFFGYFYMIYQSNGIFGNLISSTILSSSIGETGNGTGAGTGTGNGNGAQEGNSSGIILVDPSQCGANFCPGIELPLSEVQDNTTKIYTLAGTYLAVALLASVLIGFFLDHYGQKNTGESTKKLVMATLNQMRKPYQILLIPLPIWSGMGQVFMSADFTAAFITCGWGVEKIGWIFICGGIVNVISCLIWARLVRHIGRNFIIFFGAVVNMGLYIGFLNWRPNSEDTIYYFVFAGIWGLADGAWQCGISAYYGILFPEDKEAAFSNSRLWESIGYVIAFTTSNLICVDTKLYLIITALCVAMSGYTTIETLRWRKAKRESNSFVKE